MSKNGSISTEQVVYRTDLYPRIATDPALVQRYAENLDVLPAIEINQNNELIDGWHRWTAHKKVGAATIAVTITHTASDAQLLELAIERNASHGMQLSAKDKQAMARRIYLAILPPDRNGKKAHLCKLLSVSERTMTDWLKDIDKDAKKERDEKIFDLWLACRTQDEIANTVGCAIGLVNETTKTFTNGSSADSEKISKSDHVLAEFAETDQDGQASFKPPLYTLWTWSKKSEGPSHFGNSEKGIVENLIYLYTQPFDVVYDPFAGSGSTIDVCKRRLRRYYVADRLPIIERKEDIRQADVATGPPSMPWKDVRLVYLDPPYWRQAHEKYSADKEDLANMPLDDFHNTLSKFIAATAKKMSGGGFISLLMQPTQWNAPEREFTDHIAHLLCVVKLPIDIRIPCPYSTEQCTPQMVEWSKTNRKPLVISRELVVWKV